MATIQERCLFFLKHAEVCMCYTARLWAMKPLHYWVDTISQQLPAMGAVGKYTQLLSPADSGRRV